MNWLDGITSDNLIIHLFSNDINDIYLTYCELYFAKIFIA
jgi:hypothetical protein